MYPIRILTSIRHIEAQDSVILPSLYVYNQKRHEYLYCHPPTLSIPGSIQTMPLLCLAELTFYAFTFDDSLLFIGYVIYKVEPIVIAHEYPGSIKVPA